VTAQAIMGILDMPPADPERAHPLLRPGPADDAGGAAPQDAWPGDLDDLPGRAELAEPVFPVGWQIAEMFRQHRGMNKSDAYAQAVGLMERVSIPAARERVKAYPHQFSGGMRQRIMIAMAIALDPAVLIADEPTTALDVTVQAQIMALLEELQEERHMGLILITHDLGVVADVADRIAVMYTGRLVETADVHELYARRRTRTPRACSTRSRAWTRRGRRWPPSVACRRTCCASRRAVRSTRAADGSDVCRTDLPELHEVTPGRFSACHFAEEVINA
jgi:oligopeptide transport system ATP-binding protein